MHITNLSDATAVIAIISFFGGIVMYLFKKIVIEPLQKSIESLNDTLKEFKISTEKRLDFMEKRIDDVEDRTSRHDEQIKTLFSLKSKIKTKKETI